MATLLYIIHVIACLALLPAILLQSGKGGGVSAAFGGGGSGSVFGGTRGASTFLTKVTGVSAVVFMLTSLGLAYFSSARSRSVVGDVAPIEQPAAGAAPASGEPAPAGSATTAN